MKETQAVQIVTKTSWLPETIVFTDDMIKETEKDMLGNRIQLSQPSSIWTYWLGDPFTQRIRYFYPNDTESPIFAISYCFYHLLDIYNSFRTGYMTIKEIKPLDNDLPESPSIMRGLQLTLTVNADPSYYITITDLHNRSRFLKESETNKVIFVHDYKDPSHYINKEVRRLERKLSKNR